MLPMHQEISSNKEHWLRMGDSLDTRQMQSAQHRRPPPMVLICFRSDVPETLNAFLKRTVEYAPEIVS